jgi:hypothetical protein
MLLNRILFALSLIIFSYAAASAKQADLEKALIIRQSSDLLGATKATITQKALKIEIEQSNAYLIAMAPKWEVMFCNDANKRALKMAYNDWIKHVPEMNYAGTDWDRFALAIQPVRDVAILGRPAKLYKIIGKHVTKDIVSPTDRVRNGTYVALEDGAVGKEAATIMQRSIGTPQSKGVPLEFDKDVQKLDIYNTIAGKERFLHTRSIEEKDVSPQLFVYPKNYQAVKREVEVLDDPKKRKRVDGAIDLFWDGTK